jgi:hypothetical protein
MTLGISKAVELVIAKLKCELETFERDAAATRALIEALEARAGIAADPPNPPAPAPTARQVPAAKARPSAKAKTAAVKNATPRRPTLVTQQARPAKAKAKAKRSDGASPPQPSAKLSAWHQEADGSLSRTLTSVGAEEAGAPHAGAA